MTLKYLEYNDSLSDVESPAEKLSSQTEKCMRKFKVLKALRQEDTGEIDAIISKIDDRESSFYNIGNTVDNPLLYAAQVSSPTIIRYLIEKNVFDVNCQDQDGNTPLHLAVKLSRKEIIRILISHPRVDVEIRNKNNQTAQSLAATPEIEHKISSEISRKTEMVMTKFYEAFYDRNYKQLDSIYDEKTNANILDLNLILPQSGDTILHQSIRVNDVLMTRWLLERGANPFARDNSGKTSLDIAKDEEISKMLKSPQHGIFKTNQNFEQNSKMTGYLKKWTNYKNGYKQRYVVLENGVLSYYKHAEDVQEKACRGSINLRSAQVYYNASNRTNFDVLSRTFKYSLKATEPVEAQRWIWAITAAIQQVKDNYKTTQAYQDNDVNSTDGTRLGEPKPRDSMQSMESEEESIELTKEPPNQEDYEVALKRAQIQNENCIKTCDLLLQNIRKALDAKNVKELEKISNDLSFLNEEMLDFNTLFKELQSSTAKRDHIWQLRIERLLESRNLYEMSLKKIVVEQEEIEKALELSELQRKKIEKALLKLGRQIHQNGEDFQSKNNETLVTEFLSAETTDEKFYDANEISFETSEQLTMSRSETIEMKSIKETLHYEISKSFDGYALPYREKLNVVDNRPKCSLWSILKSMIGKDMTKMTLPVTFNEPLSLLQRVAEDLEYSNLLDIAASLEDSCERMLYIAAFAASEYASTLKRIAKPFNPLLGETFEYCRPDRNYRFLIEQVSHHPPIGAAWGESVNWEYYGESSVKSRFYGKSFDINPLGIWFLKLRLSQGQELYTWHKLTTSVVGIVLGHPILDNYGEMIVTNRNSGEKCVLDFKRRGWRSTNNEEVKGVVYDENNIAKWNIFGKWSDRIFARKISAEKETPILLWSVNSRPESPFNLTPFCITLNEITDSLKKYIAPTDTRLRPDQRAMEEGRYNEAANEKHRLEEKQRAKRREREQVSVEWTPKWFKKSTHPITGDDYWLFTGDYWKVRKENSDRISKGEEPHWNCCDDIF